MNFDDYINTKPPPFIKYKRYVYQEGKVIHECDEQDFEEYCKKWRIVNNKNNMFTPISERVQVDKEQYQNIVKEFNDEYSRLEQLFEDDLYKEFDVVDNPKRKLLFNKAYEYGHSSGNQEIYNHFSELVELIK